ncbi:hypothetical protein EMCRGX_G020196 [Ephydatia muelleri]
MVLRVQHNLEQQIQARNTVGVSEERLKDFTASFRHFDKDRNGKLEYQDFKSCLRSLGGYDLALAETGSSDPEFEAILSEVDPNRTGYVSLEDYMSFVIAHETENVESNKEVEIAFQAITSGGDKPYVTREELFQALSKEQAEYCIKLMKPYKAPNGTLVPGGLDYKEFAKTLF